MRRMMVRYTVTSGRGEENVEAVERVFAELAHAAPLGFSYATLRLDDGVTFVHLVSHEGADPLKALPAFQAFVAEIGERCESKPVTSLMTVVGSYRVFAE